MHLVFELLGLPRRRRRRRPFYFSFSAVKGCNSVSEDRMGGGGGQTSSFRRRWQRRLSNLVLTISATARRERRSRRYSRHWMHGGGCDVGIPRSFSNEGFFYLSIPCDLIEFSDELGTLKQSASSSTSIQSSICNCLRTLCSGGIPVSNSPCIRIQIS